MDRMWGFVAGLLLGAGVAGHALRLVVLGPEGAPARLAVAALGVILYAVATALVWQRNKLGLWIAVLGPLGGITAVTLSPSAQIDLFQVTLGIPQMVALVCSAWLLSKSRDSESSSSAR